MTEIKEIYSQSERVRIDVFVATIADVAMSLDSATTIGFAAKGIVSRFGGGTDDPSVVMVDNLAVNIVPPGLHIILR